MSSEPNMTSALEYTVASASAIIRLSTYVFLQWIPGHHFPPIIVTAAAVYFTIIVAYPTAFGSNKPSLRSSFPKLFKVEKKPEKGKTRTTEVQEDFQEPFLYPDEKTVFKTLLLGVPDWKERDYSYLTIAFNVLLTFFTLDMVFRGTLFHSGNDLRFSRVGFVGSNEAKVLFREPDTSNYPVFAYYKTPEQSGWTQVDTVYGRGEDTDFTYPLSFTNLEPDTKYIYSLSNDLDGTFTTASKPGSSKSSSLTFLTSSCIKANFPYNLLSHSLNIPGFKPLSKIIRSLPSPPSFMLFLGDFIYIDVPLRLSSSLSHYRAEYRRVYSSPSWKLPGLQIPWLHTLDDHEIANDWAGGNATEPFPAASDPFVHYHVSVNPPVPPTASQDLNTNTTYFQFSNGPASFFMLDTRRYRTPPEGHDGLLGQKESAFSHSMLGQSQFDSLLKYLQSPEPPHVHWKIIASSVPFTKNWRFGTSDTWGGFLTERTKILAAMHDAERRLGVRIIILSGDRHEFAAIRYPAPILLDAKSGLVTRDQKPEAGPHEFSVGPLSMFYLPFRTFKQVDDEDVAIAYFPDGNSKVGVVSINSIAKQQSVLKYSLWVDGKIKWEYSMTSPADDYEGSRDWFGLGSLWG